MTAPLSSQFKPPALAPSARSVGKSFMANKPSAYVAGSGEEVYEGPQAGPSYQTANRSSNSWVIPTKDLHPGKVQSISKYTGSSIYGGKLGGDD
ncbi:hypothetical protein UFOVP111_36 [uncultured Caudovirales phage]|uniref:Uncharacterized protein n=1 Tax=uncultured Caudovirales phage TaxID=2100421 RepID=A0A6J5L4F4_9CAUD|nr:hypothetical protein UFOVP111_36 [uncultured Caudovirales phage]